jgi:hypothetical protein
MLDIESGVSGEQTPLLGQPRETVRRGDMTVYKYGLKSGVCSPLTPLADGALRLLAVSSFAMAVSRVDTTSSAGLS